MIINKNCWNILHLIVWYNNESLLIDLIKSKELDLNSKINEIDAVIGI